MRGFIAAAAWAACLLGTARAAFSWVPKDFLAWASEHGKEYGSENEWEKAVKAYAQNGEIIVKLNAMQDGAEYGHNKFSDLTGAEFQQRYMPLVMDAAAGKAGGGAPDLDLDPPPESFDWRSKGAVTPVKDQQACGACWAESAVENMESAWYLANNGTLSAPVNLSVEEVIECDATANACYGGYPKDAYNYVITVGGIASEADYPYVVNGHTICLANQTFNETCGDGICGDPPLTQYCDLKCSDKAHNPVAHFSSWKALPSDEDLMASYIFANGPISVGLDAAGFWGVIAPWLSWYRKGVASPKKCTTKISHAVLAVGFGEENGKKYWTLKNSWGVKWGEAGYFRLERGSGLCGINTLATTVIAAPPQPPQPELVV